MNLHLLFRNDTGSIYDFRRKVKICFFGDLYFLSIISRFPVFWYFYLYNSAFVYRTKY